MSRRIRPPVTVSRALVVEGAFVVAIMGVLAAVPAVAHIELEHPAARWNDQKVGPCGAAEGGRTEVYAAFPPGGVVTVRWTETIDHPGHFRVSFDEDGEDDFVDPASFDDVDSAPSVLVDDIADKSGGGYEQQVTLPDVECEGCTLQLIQVMTDKAPYGDGNDLYYQCADIALRHGAPAEGETFGLEEEAPAGCSHVQVEQGAPSSSALAAGFVLALLLRRRRR